MNKSFLRLIVSIIIVTVLLCPLTVFAEEALSEEKKQVSISFDSCGGSKCETIYGYAGETEITKEMLPTPTKEGYVFIGWRHFNEYGAPFELEVFPNYDIILVAAFEKNGFSVSFEGSINETYDYNSGIELYGPKIENYDIKFIRNGWNSIRTKKGKTAPMFLLSYQNRLEKGNEYELTIWLKSDNKKTKGNVDLIYVQNPDVRDNPIGYQNAFNINEIKKGQWCEYKVKFIAAAPYVVIRMPNIDDIYIEDIEILKTGVTGELPELKKADEKIPALIIIFTTVVIISVATAVFIILKRKRN